MKITRAAWLAFGAHSADLAVAGWFPGRKQRKRDPGAGTVSECLVAIGGQSRSYARAEFCVAFLSTDHLRIIRSMSRHLYLVSEFSIGMGITASGTRVV